MYKRFDNTDFDTMSEHEILEMLLYYVIPQRNTNDIAHKLLDRFGSLAGVLAAPAASLAMMDNMGEAAARYLRLWGKTFDRITGGKIKKPCRLNKNTAEKYFKELFRGKTHEVVYMICLDPTDKIIAHEKISEGSFESAEIDASKAAKFAIANNSAQVVFVHNHPSGVCEASEADLEVTKMLERAFFVMGIRMRDHVIYTEKKCVSIMDQYHIRRNMKK